MLYASLAFVVYGLIGWFVKNLYPFSAYSMYASVAAMRDSNVPVFYAAGEEASIADYVAFEGFGSGDMWPEPRRCTLMWMVHEARRWVDEHPAGAGDAPEVPVAWGFWRVEILEGGAIARHLEIVCRGRARAR
jgi:hypothetical protein